MKSLLTLVLLAISGCAFVSQRSERNLSKIKLGATEAEVRETLGSPQSHDNKANQERWQYEIYTDDSKHLHHYDLVFSAGHLSSVRLNSSAQRSDLELREERNSSKQDFWDLNGTNGSPPLSP